MERESLVRRPDEGFLSDAFVNERTRGRCLLDGSMSPRTSQPDRVARFDWGDGATRVMITFEAKRPARSTAYVHERLADPDAAERAKADWKKRLAALKSLLESTNV